MDERAKPKRKAGKSHDPDFEQVTAYIRKDTHASVKIELLKQKTKKDFSTLLEELLQEWLRSST